MDYQIKILHSMNNGYIHKEFLSHSNPSIIGKIIQALPDPRILNLLFGQTTKRQEKLGR